MPWALRTRMDETAPFDYTGVFRWWRRAFITLLGGATCVWPLAAHRQQSTVPIIGWVAAEAREPEELGFQVDTTVKAITELAPLLRG